MQATVTKKDYLIWIIILIAALARLWGINFGLPHTGCRPDESIITDIVYSPLHSFHPGTFNYPSLYKYMVLCLYIFYFFIGIITGRYHSIVEFLTEYQMRPDNFYLINRFLSAFLGVISVFVLYKIARYVFDRKTAIISALFLGLAYLHVRDSHFGTVDVALSFFIICSLWFIVKAREGKGCRDYLMAGVLAGLAASTKYQGALLFLPMFIVHVLNLWEETEKDARQFFDKRLLLFISAFIALFLLGTPYAILDFPHFISDIIYEFRHLKYGHGIALGGWYHVRFSLFFGLGWSLFFASLAGIITLAIMDAKKAIMLCSFPLVYYLFMARGNTVFLRYIIPLIPFLCLTAAVFTVQVGGRFGPHLNHGVAFILAVLILLPSTQSIILSVRLLARKDNRLIAAEWINKNTAQGSSFYQASLFPPGKVQLYPTLGSLPETHYNPITKIAYRIPASVRSDMGSYLKNKNIVGFQDWSYNPQVRKFLYKGEIKEILPDYIIVEESPLVVYSVSESGIPEILGKSYNLKKTFNVIDVCAKENWFDQQDAFYLPFHGFRGIERPGPNLYIYEKKR
ncbi:MAG: glycosyltransferase family 39 protein [Candidatus Omnitrophota bacterium]|nr:glycosyltransferase family 39 protein [Candidatus Omnitrophota bacterium]